MICNIFAYEKDCRKKKNTEADPDFLERGFKFTKGGSFS